MPEQHAAVIERRELEMLGYAAYLISSCSAVSWRPLGYLERIILPAIRRDQIKFYFNVDGAVVAYVVWAVLDADTEQSLLATMDMQAVAGRLAAAGASPWIVDLVAPLGHIAQVLADLRDVTFLQWRYVRYLRSKHGVVIAKEVDRHAPTWFFRHAHSR